MSQTLTLRCKENGPLVIPLDAGITIQIVDHLGQPFTLPEGKVGVSICRCGASLRKPFCDGAHKTCGFQASPAVTPPPATT